MNPNANVGSIAYDSRITTAQLKKDAKEAEGIAKQTSKNIGGEMDKADAKSTSVLSNVMGKVGAVAKATAVAVGAAGVATAIFGVKSAADFQQTRIGLENMLGSADKARSLLTDISKFAAETPFEFPELAQATRQLVAFGFSGDEAFNTMKQLGDVSAAVGAPINDLAYLMGTLKTQGRAFTIDIRQFAQRGIPIYEYLAKVLKTNEKTISAMIEQGKIGFPEVQKAFQAMTAEGGKFHGTMEKQSKSLSGLFSTLKDNIGQTVREMVGIDVAGDVREGSLMDFIIKGASSATVNLPKVLSSIGTTMRDLFNGIRPALDYLNPKFVALGNTLSQSVFPILQRIYKEVIVPLAPILGVVLVAAIAGVTDALNIFFTVITPIFAWMLSNKATVIGLATAFGILAIAMNFNAIVASFNAAMNGAIITMNMFRLVTIPSTLASMSTLAAGFGPIGIAATLAAAVIIDAGNRAKAAWDATANAVRKGADSNSAALKKLQDLIKTGTPEQQARARSQIDKELAKFKGDAFATGTNFARGGLSLVGEQGPELVDLPRGSKVIPNNELGSGGGLGTNISVTVNMDGVMARSRGDLRDIAKDLIESVNEVLRAKGVAEIGGGNI